MRKAFEVERKYRISARELPRLLKKIRKLVGDAETQILQQDLFLPLGGECSNRRLRTESRKGRTSLIYTRKVRVENHGSESIRAEEETYLSRKEFGFMLEGLAKSKLPCAEKIRREFVGNYGGFKIAVCIDDVLGNNQHIGRFIEMETVLSAQRLLEPAAKMLANLASDLGLKAESQEKRGYRTMVMSLQKRPR